MFPRRATPASEELRHLRSFPDARPYLDVMHSDNLIAGLVGSMEVTGSCGSPCWHCSLKSRLMVMS
jgi:hypothetical protein